MRLATLAKKVNLTPRQLQEYLTEMGVPFEKGSNTKLTEDTVRVVKEEFGVPESEIIEENIPEVDIKVEVAESVLSDDDIYTESEKSIEQNEEAENEETEMESEEPEIEVIRAPKISLPGLKVKGKIELPEPAPKTHKEENRRRNDSSDRAPGQRQRNQKKNADDEYRRMIARRQRQKKEEQQQKRKENQEKKEIRRRHYELMMKETSQTPFKKSEKDKIPENRDIPLKPESSGNIFRRFWKWLNTY